MNGRNKHKTYYQKSGKRSFDLIVSTIIFIGLLPVVIIIAIWIKLDSAGPVFYCQQRIGKNKKPFTLYKFRTMTNHADEMKPRLKNKNEASGPFFKLKSDPRITQVGGILRKYSIDELPQVINVIKGDMSLIGPRPILDIEMNAFEQWMHERFTVMPGITGLWQVSEHKNDLPFESWISLDLSYIKHQSFRFDLWILWRTLKVILTHQNE